MYWFYRCCKVRYINSGEDNGADLLSDYLSQIATIAALVRTSFDISFNGTSQSYPVNSYMFDNNTSFANFKVANCTDVKTL